MKKDAEAGAMLCKLLAEFDSWIDEIQGQSSLVTAAFVDAQPEGSGAPVPDPTAPQPVPQGRPAMRLRIPEGARKRLSTAEKKETVMPADSPDPVVRGILTGLNRYHLWLMADAVGAVSEYYRSLFAVLGYLDPETWPCSSFGDLRIPEVDAKPLAWFEERAGAFVESRGMVGLADALTSAMPALKHGADVKTPPCVWFRGSDLVLKLIMECHGSVSEATMDEWFHGAGMEANEALRVLGVLSCIRVNGDEATLWVINVSQSSEQTLTKRFDTLLGRAQECARAGHAAAMEYFGCEATPVQPQPVSEPQQQRRVTSRYHKGSQQSPVPVQKPEVPKGKDPSFVPIRLQDPAARYRAVKGTKN